MIKSRDIRQRLQAARALSVSTTAKARDHIHNLPMQRRTWHYTYLRSLELTDRVIEALGYHTPLFVESENIPDVLRCHYENLLISNGWDKILVQTYLKNGCTFFIGKYYGDYYTYHGPQIHTRGDLKDIAAITMFITDT